ncbi:MAG: MotA/TolQ/ExbB proton channel family protein [Phycisphaeraceae bacterium]
MFLWQTYAYLMQRGGWVMWPLLGLSVVGLALIIERIWFWARLNGRGRLARVRRMANLLRQGDRHTAGQLAADDAGLYGRVVQGLLAEKFSDALATEVVEAQRRRLERFMPTLSTIITAAPMIGILGTVVGIINSFELLSQRGLTTDMGRVGEGIAQALITTAAGLVIALIVLFPYNAFRAQIEWTLGRIESLVAAAARSAAAPAGPSSSSAPPVKQQ